MNPSVVPFMTGGDGEGFSSAGSGDAPTDDQASDTTGRPPLDVAAGRFHRLEPGASAASDVAAGDDPLVDVGLLPSVEPAPEPAPRGPRCPCCRRSRTPGVERCPACGFDPAIGVSSSARFLGRRLDGGDPACPACGHVVRGVCSLRCPECGADLVGERGHRAWRREEAGRSEASYYRTPVLMAGGGLLAAGLVEGLVGLAAGGGGAVAAIQAIGVVLASFPILLGFGVAVYLVYGIMLTGIDAPLPLVVVQMAGIHGVMLGVGALLGLVPLPIVGWLVGAALYVHLLSEMMDLELNDAIAVGVITWALRTVLLVAAAALL